MALNEFPKFIGERPHPVMFLLPSNVGSYLCDIGFRHRKGTIASSPRKFTRQNIVCVDPVGRISLHELDQLLDGEAGWKIEQRVDVIGVYVIDLHVNAFGVGVFSQVTRQASRSLFIQQLFTIQGSPDYVDPAAGVGMHGHGRRA